MKNIALLTEEKRTTIIFLWLFYIVIFVYDIFYYDLFPELPWTYFDTIVHPYWYILNPIKYTLMLLLFPLSLLLIKKNYTWLVKYILLISYLSTNIVTDTLYYIDSPHPYSSGSLVELVIILFSPIFVNKCFFAFVAFGLLSKYLLIGLFIKDPIILFPITIIIVLSFIAYILLHRFLNYIDALKKLYDEQLSGIVKGFISTLELKDPYTRGHSERVAAFSMSMAKTVGHFNELELQQFYYACLLHDIGKVNIPDSILTKSGKLTNDEYEIIKTHPVVGADVLQDVEGLANHIDVIYHHHERWDGKGYPDGLAGENTPLLARITAVADAFDAMTSSRSYRPALPYEEAYRRILAGEGSQFDPYLVGIFKEVYPDWVEISKHYYKGMVMGEVSK